MKIMTGISCERELGLCMGNPRRNQRRGFERSFILRLFLGPEPGSNRWKDRLGRGPSSDSCDSTPPPSHRAVAKRCEPGEKLFPGSRRSHRVHALIYPWLAPACPWEATLC